MIPTTIAWYRSLTPDGGLWTESRSLSEIHSEAMKWDPAKGALRIQKMTETIVHTYSDWESVG